MSTQKARAQDTKLYDAVKFHQNRSYFKKKNGKLYRPKLLRDCDANDINRLFIETNEPSWIMCIAAILYDIVLRSVTKRHPNVQFGEFKYKNNLNELDSINSMEIEQHTLGSGCIWEECEQFSVGNSFIRKHK